MLNIRDLPVLNPVVRALALQKAYSTEFKGNLREGKISREAAEAWAEDYPKIFKEYQGAVQTPYTGA